MKFYEASLEAMAVKPAQYPEEALPEIAFAGRSNVGKSTFINTFAGRKKLAYTSSTPGKTRTVNFYLMEASFGPEAARPAEGAAAAAPDARASASPAEEKRYRFRFVDLPGYGFAKASKGAQEEWAGSINTYLAERKDLLEVFLLCDLRHAPTEQDRQMYAWILAQGFSGYVIATKADKVPTTKRRAQARRIAENLGAAPGKVLVYAGNAATKPAGVAELQRKVREILDGAEAPADFTEI